MRVKMLKTRDPNKVPNGSVGFAYDDITLPGLHAALFGGDILVYVYPDEVEEYEGKDGGAL